MSQPQSLLNHPFDVARHPTLEPEVKHAILASWASDASAVAEHPALRRPRDTHRRASIDDVLAALRALDPPSRPRVDH